VIADLPDHAPDFLSALVKVATEEFGDCGGGPGAVRQLTMRFQAAALRELDAPATGREPATRPASVTRCPEDRPAAPEVRCAGSPAPSRSERAVFVWGHTRSVLAACIFGDCP